MFGAPDWEGQMRLADCERRRRGLLRRTVRLTLDLQEDLERAEDEWVLLLALTSEGDRGGPPMGDMGTLYFFVRRDDLARGDFTNVRAGMFSH